LLIFVKKYGKQQKRFLGQVTFWGKAMFSGSSTTVYIDFFFKIWGLWVSKDAEFNADFKNNLP
jgi:hypothetical protein